MKAVRKTLPVLLALAMLFVASPSVHSQEPPLPHAVKLCTNYNPGGVGNAEVCRFLNYHTIYFADQEAIGRIERASNGDNTIYHVKLQGKNTAGGSWTTVRSWIGPDVHHGTFMERSTVFADMSSWCYRRAEVKFRVQWPGGADTGVLVRYSGTENVCD